MLSQGVPMLLAGDEIGHSQGGNNNAYAQDNAVTWLDWSRADTALAAFVARLAALRAQNPVLRQRRFLHGAKRGVDGQSDVMWLRANGTPPAPHDWHDPAFRALGVVMRMSAEGMDPSPDAVLIYFNCGGAVPVTLPAGHWTLVLDTTQPELTRAPAPNVLPAHAVLLLRAHHDPATPETTQPEINRGKP
jgi:glycogen operon protein